MSRIYYLSVDYFPVVRGVISCRKRLFCRHYRSFEVLKRDLRYLKRFTKVLSFHIEDRPE